MSDSTFKPISAWLPVAMSLAALGLIILHIAAFGIARQKDEGALAHIWQLLMIGQLPVMMIYAVGWLPRAPKATVQVIGVQLAAAAAAVAPIYLLRW